jgi:hypothetical protein
VEFFLGITVAGFADTLVQKAVVNKESPEQSSGVLKISP